MNNNEKEILNKFLEKFCDNTTRILSKSLDTDVFPNIEFSIKSSDYIEDAQSLRSGNMMYKLDYAESDFQGLLALLIPEKFISVISDLLMGGKGDKEYSGEISELEINASSSLLQKIFKEIETSFKKLYNRDLAFDADPKFFVASKEEFDIEFSNFIFDYAIVHQLKLDDEKVFEITLLLKSKDIRQRLISLNLLQSLSKEVRHSEIDGISIEQINDVKIDITAELGRARVPIKYALELVKDSIVKLDALNNSDIKVFANGIEVANAQVVAVGDSFGLRITKIISPEERLGSIT